MYFSTVKTALKTIAIIVAIALMLYGLFLVRTILLYILIAALISMLGRPIMNLLNKVKIKRFKLPSSLNAVFILLFFISLIVGLVSIFVPLVIQQARILSATDVNEVLKAFNEPMERVQSFLAEYELSDEQFDEKYLRLKIRELLRFSVISDAFQSLFGILGNVFIALFSILFMSFFFLRDGSLLTKIITGITPRAESYHVKSILDNTKRLLTRYCLGLVVQVSLVTLIVSSSLYFFLGVENALIIGFLAGMLNLVPYLGPIMGAILAVGIVMLTNLDLSFYDELLPMSGWVLLIFACMQLIDNMFTQPVIFSNVVNAHPLEIFIVISVAGTIYGITGMVFAIPVYTVLRIIAKEFFSQYRIVERLTKNL